VRNWRRDQEVQFGDQLARLRDSRSAGPRPALERLEPSLQLVYSSTAYGFAARARDIDAAAGPRAQAPVHRSAAARRPSLGDLGQGASRAPASGASPSPSSASSRTSSDGGAAGRSRGWQSRGRQAPQARRARRPRKRFETEPSLEFGVIPRANSVVGGAQAFSGR
jgi:hypothetical protein